MTEWLHIWRGITLSTILGKLHCGINLAVLRIIIEQTVEWQTSLYLNLIDFQKKNFRYHRPSCPVGYLPCNSRGKTRLRLSPLLSMILLDWVNKTGTKSQKASDGLLRYPTPIGPLFYFEDLWLDCQNLSFILKIFIIKHDSPQGFWKLLLDFEILYTKVSIETYGKTVFFAFKTRWGNNFHKSYGKWIEKIIF